MRTEVKNVLGFIALQLWVLTAPAIAEIEAGPSLPPTKGKFSDLTFWIGSSDGPFLPLEPIPFKITIANKTSEAILGHDASFPEWNLFEIYVARQGESFEEFHTLDWLVRPEGVKRVFPPGFSESRGGYLYYAQKPGAKQGQYLLPSPGTYQVKGRLTNVDRTATIESNVLTVEALAPKGQDAEAYAYLRSAAHPAFLMLGGYQGHALGIVRNTPTFGDLEAFAGRFANSRYALYANYTLGMTYAGSGQSTPADDLRKGVALLEKAALLENPFFADRSLSELVDLYVRFEEVDKAKQALVSLLGRSGNKEIV